MLELAQTMTPPNITPQEPSRDGQINSNIWSANDQEIPPHDRTTTQTLTDGTTYINYWDNRFSVPIYTEIINP